uniref:Uncharacterized protein n=1 Tax=Pipistrellus kuhlii TaxID=59472 RepID=A0A7J7TA61_PIPKU|nr:hypothetical protein mPipKuh1_009681 [Pipistrellus kuhlii]
MPTFSSRGHAYPRQAPVIPANRGGLSTGLEDQPQIQGRTRRPHSTQQSHPRGDDLLQRKDTKQVPEGKRCPEESSPQSRGRTGPGVREGWTPNGSRKLWVLIVAKVLKTHPCLCSERQQSKNHSDQVGKIGCE